MEYGWFLDVFRGPRIEARGGKQSSGRLTRMLSIVGCLSANGRSEMN